MLDDGASAMERPWHLAAAALGAGRPAVMVTLFARLTQGAREAGARILVSEEACAGSVGGGALELAVVARARDLLGRPRGSALESLGEADGTGRRCGGRARFHFRILDPQDRAWVGRLAEAEHSAEPAVLLSCVGDAEGPGVGSPVIGPTDEVDGLPRGLAAEVRRQLAGSRAPAALRAAGKTWLIEAMEGPGPAVWLFGAGHLGQAVARALAPLPFDLTWLDAREGLFPEGLPGAVACRHCPAPDATVAEAPPGAAYLVMTHGHGMDFAICEAVLRRGDAAYLGMVGSARKAAACRMRLTERGIDPGRLGEITTPIGLDGITGRAPAVIAASVAADLLLRLIPDRPAP
jgi:xanthine dehydrogenase accessory factor